MKSNVLMVANYPSDAAYAWWLMEFFWVALSELDSVDQSFVAYPKLNAIPDTITNSKIEPRELDYNNTSVSGMIELLNFIKARKIRILYLTDKPYFSPRYLLLRVAGVEKIVVHDHTPGDRPPAKGIKGFIKSIRNRLTLLTADLVLNVSPLMKKRSEENGRIPTAKCISVQNGINTQAEQNVPHPSVKPRNIRHELNIPSNTLLLVTASRLHPYKNIDFAIKALDQALVTTEKDIHLIILGDGPDEANLKSLAASCNFPNNVHFLGYRNDVEYILKQSDMAIHCARGEGFSLSIIEYMKHGLPVIVPDTPSVAQAIDDRVTGFIFKANVIKEAADKIALLIDKGLREEMGTKAKIKFLKNYSLENTKNQFMIALKSIEL